MGLSLHGLAARQLADYRACTPGSFFGEEDRPRLTLDDAYAVQAEVARLRVTEGESVAGYKVGATGPGTRRQFGMDGPVRGFLYVTELHPSGSTLSHASYANLAIEGELAVSGTTPRSRASSRSSSFTTTSSDPRPRHCRSLSQTAGRTPAWCSRTRTAPSGETGSPWMACCGSRSTVRRSRRAQCPAYPVARGGRCGG
jgi:hypothetical protein